MERNEFYQKLKETLEIDGEVNENTSLNLSSLEMLTVIAFIDENFDKQVKAVDLRNISTVHDLIQIIGLENFS